MDISNKINWTDQDQKCNLVFLSLRDLTIPYSILPYLYRSVSPDKHYDLPPVLKTQRSSSFGYGTKTDFSKIGAANPAPGNYELIRDF